jgi:hypothetical protein
MSVHSIEKVFLKLQLVKKYLIEWVLIFTAPHKHRVHFYMYYIKLYISFAFNTFS